jgi:DNA-binding phage protein
MPDPKGLSDETRLLFKLVMEGDQTFQSELAAELGVTRARVNQMLRPGSNMTLKTVEKVAQALGYKAEVKLTKVTD